ncbi:MAG: ABC transporter substrate-binding protein, partial [Nitrospinota bacterium]
MGDSVKLRIGLGALAANQSIPWLCREAGLFQEEGLDAVITFEPPAVRTLAVVLDGEVDLCTFGGAPVIQSTVEGKPTEIILNLNHFNHLSVVAKRAISRPQDLKGRTLGGFSLKGNADFTLDLLLPKWGLKGDDIERVPYWAGFQAACEGLLAGEVDAAILPLPFSFRAIREGYNLLWDGKEMTYQGGVGFALQSFAAERKEIAERFLRAYSKGVKAFKSDPDLAKRVLRENIPSLGDDENLETTYRFWAEHVPDPPRPSLKGIRTILDGLAAAHPRAKSVKPIDCVAKSLWPD